MYWIKISLKILYGYYYIKSLDELFYMINLLIKENIYFEVLTKATFIDDFNYAEYICNINDILNLK